MTSRCPLTCGATRALLATLMYSLTALGPPVAWAQDIVACVHANSGLLYVKEATTNGECTGDDVELILSPGVSDHGVLDGLGDDDHPQYVLVDGVRDATDGFAVTGTKGTGAIPATGAGVRIMWYPGKAAFRVGETFGSQWDDANIGARSIAMGAGTIASLDDAMAFGNFTEASGGVATAFGQGTTASGNISTAFGQNTTASGARSTAMGVQTTASGNFTTAMGANVSTDGHAGSFIYGDASAGVDNVTADNSFVVRAKRVFFGKDGDQVATADRYIETSTGAYLSDGGAWTDASSRALKENFLDEDGESTLAKVVRLPVQSWNYRAEDSSVRHLGPTAEDFHAAFGLGDDASIASLDVGGVTLLAVQALEARTRALREENADLREEVAALRREVAALGDPTSIPVGSRSRRP